MAKEDFMKLIPDIRGLGLDPRAEQEYFMGFMRVYQYFESKLSAQQREFDNKISLQNAQIERQNSLVNSFATPLIGITNQTNPLATLGTGTVTTITIDATLSTIFEIENASTTPNLKAKTQVKNKFWAGPITGADAVPTFRTIVAADISGLALDTTILDWLAQ